MRWSLALGSIRGTEIRIHITFLIFLVWLWMVFYGRGGAAAAWQGTTFIVLIFLCVLLHELGHVFAARRYGVPTRDVTLWPFGGIASMERMPDKPMEELIVAVAGPAVNVVIAGLLLLWVGPQLAPDNLTALEDPGVSLAAKLAGANIVLVLFNLIPAFPMDGGRVLRALLAMRMSNARATELAANIGQGFAVVFGILGLFYNPMLIIIAGFIFLAASGEASQAQLKAVAKGTLVSDAMITAFETLDMKATVADAADALIRTTQKEFPVVDAAGHMRGLLTRDAMVKAMKQTGPETPVLEAMQTEIPMMSARASLESALRALTEKRQPAVGVTGPDGKLVGLLTPENLGELMMLNGAHPKDSGKGSGGYVGPWSNLR
ncbi:site-2 protease family protein [Methyloligella solikamskensis]|uniref:Zinc metalloprotease n=1 Tax=Methyloligella solikamskensis TaxID=1177756 RepID=A0ABW3J6W5_9HYPH